MKKQNVKASFTNREMETIASMLLSNNGINVDPIINDLYPTLEEKDKSLFRCKMALLLSGKMPEFQTYEGFRMDGSKKCLKYKCVAESSLLGVSSFEIIEIWRKKDEQWVQDTEDPYNEIGSVRTDSMDLDLYASIEEAEKHW